MKATKIIDIKNLTVTNQIKDYYRTFAIYSLVHRGIPNFYDALTDVQRLLLSNTPKKITKTLSVVGDAISGGYLHGNASLENAVAKLARPFGCSYPILNGDGFFGSILNSSAAQARYTSVSMSPKVAEFIDRYKFLKREAGQPLNVNFPIGLLTTIIGLAPGYKSMILPRKMEHIISFLSGSRKNVPPYFVGFTGKISMVDKLPNAWLLEGVIEKNESSRTLHITSIPPLLKYESFVKKLDKILFDYDDGISIENNSNDTVDITIKIASKNSWDALSPLIIKATKQIIRESIVLIKDNKVTEYERIEDYLIDFRNKNHLLEAQEYEYYTKYHQNEFDYLGVKLKYFNFMLLKKRSKEDIDEFLKSYKLYYDRLDAIRLRNLTTTELANIKKNINKNKTNILTYNKKYDDKIEFIDEQDFTLHLKRTVNLFENEIKELDGIEILQTKIEEHGSTD